MMTEELRRSFALLAVSWLGILLTACGGGLAPLPSPTLTNTVTPTTTLTSTPTFNPIADQHANPDVYPHENTHSSFSDS